MYAGMQTVNIMRSMVPVSRFNKGEAAKIFDEVIKSGIKIAVKNNKPACVLLSPDHYESIIVKIENLQLIIETEKRLATPGAFYSHEEIMDEFNITQADLDSAEDVEIE